MKLNRMPTSDLDLPIDSIEGKALIDVRVVVVPMEFGHIPRKDAL